MKLSFLVALVPLFAALLTSSPASAAGLDNVGAYTMGISANDAAGCSMSGSNHVPVAFGILLALLVFAYLRRR